MNSVIEAPVIETQPGMIDMAELEATFAEAEAIHAAGALAAAHEVEAAPAEEVQLQVGFNPDLLAMFLRATPGSEFSKNLSNLLVTDLVVNNAVAFGLLEQQRETEELYHYTESKKED